MTTTCLVICGFIYNQSRALSSKSHARSAGRFEGLPVPRTGQQEYQARTHRWVLGCSADQDGDGSGRDGCAGCAGQFVSCSRRRGPLLQASECPFEVFSYSFVARPARLPTPVGISRVFVARDHRCKGIGHALLDAMSQTFIHACPLDPVKGQIAFSQPTGDGRRLMESWGRGKIRVYEE